MFPNIYSFNPGMVIDPITMAPMITNHGGTITVNPLGVPSRPQQKIWQKMFIQDIPQECPNQAVIRLLKQFGAAKNFKRTSDIKGNLVSFCFFQLETAQQIMRIRRLFKNIRILDKTLQLKISPQTQNFLKQWNNMQRQQWRKKLLAPGSNQAKQYETIQQYNERDDKKYKQRIQQTLKAINTQVKKIAIQKMRQQERKQHPKQKQRQKRKKQYLQDMKRKFHQKQDSWLKRQHQKDRQSRRQRQKQKQRQRAKYKRLERQIDLDPQQQQSRINKFRNPERRKAIDRQQQEDLDKILEQNPPQPDQGQNKKVKVTFFQEKKGQSRQQQEMMMVIPDEHEKENNKIIQEQNKNEMFQGWQMEEENEEQQKPKFQLNLPEVPQQNKEEDESKKAQLIQLAKQIPQNKMQLWQYPIDWDSLAKSVVFEKRIRPFLQKGSIQYMGSVEQKFIALVQKKLLSRSHPDKIMMMPNNLLLNYGKKQYWNHQYLNIK